MTRSRKSGRKRTHAVDSVDEDGTYDMFSGKHMRPGKSVDASGDVDAASSSDEMESGGGAIGGAPSDRALVAQWQREEREQSLVKSYEKSLEEGEEIRQHWGKNKNAYYEYQEDTSKDAVRRRKKREARRAANRDVSKFRKRLEQDALDQENLQEEVELLKEEKRKAVGSVARASLQQLREQALSEEEEEHEEAVAADRVVDMSDADVVQMMQRENPEFFALIEDVHSQLDGVTEALKQLSMTEQQEPVDTASNNVFQQILRSKSSLYILYSKNLMFYLLLKSSGASPSTIATHPVVKAMVRQRIILESLETVEKRVLKRLSSQQRRAAKKKKSLEQPAESSKEQRPNIGNILRGRVATPGSTASEPQSASSDVYRPSGLMAVAEEPTNALERSQKLAEKLRSRMRQSAVAQEMKAQLMDHTDMPLEMQTASDLQVNGASRAGMSKQVAAIEDELEHRDRYEEENFLRLMETKSLKKKRRIVEASRAHDGSSHVTNMFDDFDEFEKVQQWADEAAKYGGASLQDQSAVMDSDLNALQAFQQEQRARRKQARFAGSQADLDLYEEYAQDRASKKASKRERKKRAEGVMLQEQDPMNIDSSTHRRAATQEIIKNRGLVRYRSRSNKNPRVKFRRQYEKARIRRRGQVQSTKKTDGSSYEGERTGINAFAIRSQSLGMDP